MRKVVILGNDHTNTLGLTQTLGLSGYYCIALLWGNKRDLVKSSKFCKKIYSAKSPEACIEVLLSTEYGKDGVAIPIIATCDSAALALEAYNDKLKGRFVFEYASKDYSLHQLMEKKLQVQLATDTGFNVPKSWTISNFDNIPSDLIYPCLIKPLVSCKGAKDDIRVCKDENEYRKNLHSLKYTTEVLIQQYIDRDFEISILGCGLSTGEVIIPAVENKLTLFPKYVGLECLARMNKLTDLTIIKAITNLVHKIGYVGVFSVEMMHCKADNKFYFTEINLRNDGANSFVYKYGVNLPLNHVEDLTGLPITKFNNFNPGYYIWDMHHFMSVAHFDINIWQWIKELWQSKGFLTYFKEDKAPFYKQYVNFILNKLHLRKNEEYC